MEMAAQSKAPNLDLFDAYFRRADLDRDGRISGAEAVSFFQGSGLPKQVLAQIWMHADQHRIGFLGRAEFYNALKLVTVAQSKRELTSDIVKAALYSPASAKIPAPQINLAVVPSPAPAAMVAANAVASTQISGFQGPQVSMGASTNQHHMPNQLMRHPQSSSESTIRPVQGMVVQGFPVGGPIVGPHSPVTSTPNDLSGDGMGGAPRQTSFQASSSGPDTSTSKYESGLVASGFTVAKPPRPREIPGTVLSGHPITDFKATGVSGNGFAIDATFAGDAVSVMPSQERQEFSVPSFSAVSTPVSSGLLPPSAGVRPPLKSSLLDSFQTAPTMQPVGGQQQSSQFFMQQNHQVSTQGTSSFASAKTSLGVENSASIQSQLPWPKMTQTDFQKYTKVFVEVDTDRDGKIAGEQARNLFLSWRLPREVLKQVWDLSDQDNDSMLSLREFCIALYLMERYREGRPLPAALPSSLMIDFPTTVQSTTRYGNAAWRPTAGWQQHQGTSGPTARQGASSAGARPPLPPSPQAADGKQAVQPKHRVPVLENHLVDQLSKEEQESLKSKFQDATEADKKVEELEKEILDSKQKIEFYRAKMQELVLYKSRCDNRLNEFMERVSVDRHEVELFAKKYEEKYKQVGGVVSNLTSEEATFRDIQEKKIELYQAIVKMEEDGNADGALQARADNIQSELDGLVKSVNERCKKYGLLLKPTTLVELPFGWQPGIQEGAADWDEDWDMFKDEGFTFVKELTLDVQNVVAPPKPKSRLAKKDKLSNVGSSRITASSSTNVKSEDSEMKSDSMDGNSENTEIGPVKSSTSTVQIHENGSVHIQGEYDTRRSTADTPIESGVTGGPFRELSDSSFHKSPDVSSLHATEAQSDPVGSEAFSSSDKATFDEPAWGTFDNDDVSSVWGFDSTRRTKEMDRESQTENYFFGSGDFGLAPIRTGSSQADRFFHNPSSIFADSVPSTPLHSSGNQTKTDSLYSDRLFQRMGPFGFADSVPSTPLSRLGNSPPRFSDASGHSFDAFSRLDSFDTRGAREPLSRFDSMSSNRDFDHNRELARFDSMRSTKDFNYSGGFPLFDDSDPFGSSGGRFKTSLESQTPRGWTDNWKAF